MGEVGEMGRCGCAPQMVIATPVMLSGESSSPKTQAEMVIVVTSFAMPAIDMGTTPARRMMLYTRIRDQHPAYGFHGR